MVHPRRFFVILVLVVSGLVAVAATVGAGMAMQLELSDGAVIKESAPDLAPAPTAAIAPDIVVCEVGCVYSSVQEAIVNASPGDTILIDDPSHTESGIVITKNISIVGHGAAHSTIQAAETIELATDRIFEVAEGYTATVADLTVRYGSSSSGGAIYNSGVLTLSNVEINNSQSDDFGGAIYNTISGTLYLYGSTLYNNVVTNTNTITGTGGGGLYNEGITLIRNSTVASNTAGNAQIAAGGGGLLNSGVITIENVTVASNSAGISGTGAGISNTISGTLAVENSIVAGNVDGDDCDDAGSWSATGVANLDGDGTCPDFSIQEGYSGLNPLAYYGGPVRTLAIQFNSDARDSGSACPSTDQRGAARPFGSGCDLGAYESHHAVIETTPSLAIPDDDVSGVSDIVTVTLPLSATEMPLIDVDLFLGIAHTNTEDLRIELAHMGENVRRIIMDQPVSDNCDDVNATFDDEATESVDSACNSATVIPLDGSVVPSQSLDAFDTFSSAGPWMITVSDRAMTTTGTLMTWTLYLEYRPPLSVTTTGDPAEDGCQPGDCSLREAIIDANQDPGPDTIVFNNEGTYTLSQAGINDDWAYSGDLDINEDLIIIGRGPANTIIDANQVDRVFDIGQTGPLNAAIYDLSIRGGDIAGRGGGLRVNGGQVTLEQTHVMENEGNYGGGISIQNGGTLTVSYSRVQSNTAINTLSRDGGGIYAANADVTISETDFSNNSGRKGGGVAIVDGGTLRLSHSRIHSNMANDDGGGIYVDTSVASILGSAIFDNAIGSSASNLGGGIYNLDSTLYVENSTLSGHGDEGLYNHAVDVASTAMITNVTIADNDTGVLSLGQSPWVAETIFLNTIVANNGLNCSEGLNGENISLGHNLNDSATLCNFDESTDNVGVANIGSLEEDSGSGTWFHRLAFPSPAIDGALEAECPALDQRGLPRRGFCDIGAAEFEGFLVSKYGNSGTGTLRGVVEEANSFSGPDTIYFAGFAGQKTITLSSGELEITDDLTINGPGSGKMNVDGNGASRIFHINGDIPVAISGLTLVNGDAGAGNGGGILNEGGQLTLSDLVFEDNQATIGGAVAASASGAVSLTDGVFEGNLASSRGGALYLETANATFTRTSMVNNSATGFAVGGIYAENSSVSLYNSTLSHNNGRAIYVYLNGGSIEVNLSFVTLANHDSGLNVVAENNATAEASLYHTLFAEIDGDSCSLGAFSGSTVSSTSLGYNLVATGDQSTVADCDFIGTDKIVGNAGLGPLQLDSGTWVRPISSSSPAVDAGSNSNCPSVDQRGAGRPADGDGDGSAVCDIGAYELQDVSFELYLPIIIR